MRRVTWAIFASANPMGQQRHEHEIREALRGIAGPEWSFADVMVTRGRSRVPGARRTSMRLNTAAPLAVSRLAGRLLYGNPQLVHRFDPRLPAARGEEVVTIHDLAPLHFRDEWDLTRSALEGARRAARVIAPSAFAAAELVNLAGIQDVSVIPNGLSPEYRDAVALSDAELRDLGITGRFVMHAGGATRRKNLDGLAQAWPRVAASNPEISLVLCGASDRRRDEAFAGQARVVKTGRVDTPVVAGLMRRAAAVVVPSIYEGFGLPALEGMACGAPVVAARRGALPEVCGEAALLVEPDGRSIAEALEQVLVDEQLAQTLRERGRSQAGRFRWELAAQKHLEVYASVVA